MVIKTEYTEVGLKCTEIIYCDRIWHVRSRGTATSSFRWGIFMKFHSMT